MTLRELQAVARSRKLRGWSRLRKAELAALLGVVVERTATVAELRAQARRLAIPGLWRMRKAELLATLATARQAAATRAGSLVVQEPDAPEGEYDPLEGRYLGPNVDAEDTEAEIVRVQGQTPSTLDEARAMVRYMNGRETPTDCRILDARRLRAIVEIRDACRMERAWQRWNGVYLATITGIESKPLRTTPTKPTMGRCSAMRYATNA